MTLSGRLGKTSAMRSGRNILLVAVVAVTSACGGPEEPELMNITNPGEGPDEFTVNPNKPLEIPEDVAALELPLPTPGGTNLAGPTPEADMVAALGGNLENAVSGNGALISYTTRFGSEPNIRADLALVDLEWRRRNDGRLLERIANVNVYFNAYEELSLDQYAELDRFRRAGIKTPSAPPNPEPPE